MSAKTVSQTIELGAVPTGRAMFVIDHLIEAARESGCNDDVVQALSDALLAMMRVQHYADHRVQFKRGRGNVAIQRDAIPSVRLNQTPFYVRGGINDDPFDVALSVITRTGKCVRFSSPQLFNLLDEADDMVSRIDELCELDDAPRIAVEYTMPDWVC